MADEIKITTAAVVNNGNYRTSFQPGTVSVTQAAKGVQEAIVSVGFAAAEALVYGDVTTKGWYYGRNLDSANFVTWGPYLNSTMVPMGKVEAGETFMFRGDSTSVLGLQADTAAVDMHIVVLED